MPTLRNLIIDTTTFYDLTKPAYIPDPTSGYGLIPNPDSDAPLFDAELSDAIIWTATLLARTSGYHSDSTLDSHNAIIATLNALHTLCYGADQTMMPDDALDAFLDDESLPGDLEMTINHNCVLTEPMPPLPAFYARFNLDYDTIWG